MYVLPMAMSVPSLSAVMSMSMSTGYVCMCVYVCMCDLIAIHTYMHTQIDRGRYVSTMWK